MIPGRNICANVSLTRNFLSPFPMILKLSKKGRRLWGGERKVNLHRENVSKENTPFCRPFRCTSIVLIRRIRIKIDLRTFQPEETHEGREEEADDGTVRKKLLQRRHGVGWEVNVLIVLNSFFFLEPKPMCHHLKI